MSSRFILVSAFTLLVACGGATSNEDPSGGGSSGGTSSSPAADASPGEGGGSGCKDGETKSPAGSTDGCFGGSNHVCGDYSRPYVCEGGAFRCPKGSVPASECWCFAMNPPAGACSCTPSGWSCAGADAGADADAGQ